MDDVDSTGGASVAAGEAGLVVPAILPRRVAVLPTVLLMGQAALGDVLAGMGCGANGVEVAAGEDFW